MNCAYWWPERLVRSYAPVSPYGLGFVCISFLDAMDVWLTASLAALLLMLLLQPISLMDRSSSAQVCSFVDSSNFVNVIGSHLHITENPRHSANLLVFIWYICSLGEGRLGLQPSCQYGSLFLLDSILLNYAFYSAMQWNEWTTQFLTKFNQELWEYISCH